MKICAAALAAAGALAAAPAAKADDGLALNLAPGGSVQPASAAKLIDGSATTTWCPSEPGTSAVVDLGRPTALTGAGITMKDASGVQVEVSANGRSWDTVSKRGFTAAANEPEYLRFDERVRYARVTVANAACVGEFRLFGPSKATRDWALGSDLSFALNEEEAGTVFTDRGRAKPVERIMASHGSNYVRLRLWVNPPAGYQDLAYDLELARRIRAAGMKLYLDIQYSDFWADPQHQDTPSTWAGQDLPTLANTVQTYTRRVMSAFAAQGTPADMVSIGNEVRNGILWPVGQLNNGGDQAAQWHAFGTLLKAGVAGAKAANPRGHQLKFMIHYDQGGDRQGSQDFYDHVKAEGVPFDVIGLSYYSFWHGPLTALKANLDNLAERYGKPVMIAEIQYAWTLGYGDSTNNFVWEDSQLEPGYPASPAGQLSFVNDVLSILGQVPHGLGQGLFYWEPEWVPGVGWEPGAGTPNDNLTLFDFQGRALPSIGIFQDPVRSGA
jgi:arabinogalactan endo-1,4-beta-galactosidase